MLLRINQKHTARRGPIVSKIPSRRAMLPIKMGRPWIGFPDWAAKSYSAPRRIAESLHRILITIGRLYVKLCHRLNLQPKPNARKTYPPIHRKFERAGVLRGEQVLPPFKEMLIDAENQRETRSSHRVSRREHPGRIHVAFDDRRTVNDAGPPLPGNLSQHLGLYHLAACLRNRASEVESV